MLKVELIYSDDCPNVVQARAELVRAFFETKMHPHWEEWQVEDARCPPALRAYGSPTVLVARRDVAPAAESTQRSCRLYFAPDGT